MSRWPVEETGMNSVIPSTIPKMRAIIQSDMNHLTVKTLRRASQKLFLSAPESFLLDGALLDLELSENSVPADINFVPLSFEAAECAFAHLAQIAQRRRAGDKVMDFFARGRGDF